MSCSSHQIDSSSTSEIERLDEAANFLMLVSDDEKELVNRCQLSPSEALNLLRPLHALIDEESQKKFHITSKYVVTCEENCHCGIFSDLAIDSKIKDDLLEKAENIPRKKLIFCAQKTSKWICEDKLMNILKSELNSQLSEGL